MGLDDPRGITPRRVSRDADDSLRLEAAPAGPVQAAGRVETKREGPAASKGGAVRARSRASDTSSDPTGPSASDRHGEAVAAVRSQIASGSQIASARPSDRRVEWVRAAVANYERPLTQYATHLLAGDVERARDLVQEAFLRLCDQEQESVQDHVVEWLYTVCRNLAIDVKRKERRMRLITDEQQDSFAATYESPTEAAERVDAAGRVSEVIQTLPPRQQEIVRLKFQHGMSYKEIGKVMNLTATNVGFILHTAIKSLREHLAGEGHESESRS